MRLLLINAVCGYGSTGRIVLDIAKEYEQNGYEVKIAYGRNGKCPDEAKKYAMRIGSDIDVYWHVLYTRLTDKHGLASKRSTKKFLKWAEEYDPDILWLHNIHGYYINYEMLFNWIKTRPKMKVKWTLHDCWTFTGHCSHFTYIKCYKWKNGCRNCPQLNQYPKSIVDKSKSNYARKKAAFTGISDLEIVTPSNWLKKHVTDSFFKEYPVKVVYNRIDTSVFNAVESNFKEKHGIQDKKMILGVANTWDQRKGLNDILKLAGMLDTNKYSVVVVGLNSKQIDKIGRLGIRNLIILPRTSNATELAEIYSAADIFINPSYEETFGLTTAEAQACGTYTLVYKGTACEEIIDKNNGHAAEDINEMYMLICDRLG